MGGQVEGKRKRGIWISPIRRIEFRLCTHACKFEELRIMYDNDEVRAWKEYRRITAGMDVHEFVVCP